MTRIAITGAAGRMGRRIAALAIDSEQFDIVSAMEYAGHGDIGADIGELAGLGAFGVVNQRIVHILAACVVILHGTGRGHVSLVLEDDENAITV